MLLPECSYILLLTFLNCLNIGIDTGSALWVSIPCQSQRHWSILGVCELTYVQEGRKHFPPNAFLTQAVIEKMMKHGGNTV